MGSMGRMLYSIGFWVRETGQALDRLGCSLQGNAAFKEECTTQKCHDQMPLFACCQGFVFYACKESPS